MNSYHRLWLSLLVLAIITTSMCGLANEHDVSENAKLKHDSHHLEATLKEMSESDLSGGGGDISIELYQSLRFEPSQLDFGIWSVGTVRSHTVTLVNQNRNRSVYLSSVSGRTPAFYSSFFEAKMVPPNGNTTFNVVFLPREQGAISTNLHIHTSFGKLRLLVRGEGRECPYRLKPLVGIKAPLNATLMPEIHMYNPHEKTLQILEVYSSGGQFQLELPSGDSEAPQGLWEIPPFTTKPVIRIRFQGFTAGNHSAYIRIKIAEPHNTSRSSGATDEQVLVIPVEFEILPEYGLYAVNPLLEFGYITVDSLTKPLKQNLTLRHSKNQLEINDLEFKSMSYISGVTVTGHDIIELDPNQVEEAVMRLNEKLELQLKDKNNNNVYTYHNVDLIIRADIFKGNLHYDTNKTIFLTHPTSLSSTSNKEQEQQEQEDDQLDERLLTVRNDFQIPMAIYNVTTNHNDTTKLSLQLISFDTGMVLKPGNTFDVLKASSKLQQKQQQQDLKDLTNYKTAIYIYTNITNFEIPIVISSARLFVTTQTLAIWRSNSSVYTKELHLGSIPIQEMSHKGFIIFQNRNSIPIKLNNWDFQKAQGIYYSVFFLGSIKASALNKTNNYAIDLDRSDYKFTSQLDEGDTAVYVVSLQPYTTQYNSAYLKISTLYENITITVKFTTAMGRLEVDQEKLHFANCFPGKLCSSELSIRSTFKQSIHIKHINFTDAGLEFEDKNPHGSKITPQSVTTVGRIFFQPSALCGSLCYINNQQTDEAATFPSTVLENSLNIPNFDEVELRRRTELYRHFKYYFQNMDFTMTTKEMQHFQLNLMIELQWPQLVVGRQALPTIEVNKSFTYEVKITNPSDNPILIDYSLSDPTLAKQTQISLPLEVVAMTPSCYLTDKAVFSLVNTAPKKPILIPGLTSVKIPIKFESDAVGTYCTLLHIRNNLTLYEGVWISAKTVQSQFRLGNRKPGSLTPLLFEITEQHLESACPVVNDEVIRNDKMEKQLQPQVISRRIFTARNSGELTIKIEGFWIGDQHCKGYGFQVMDCSSFELKANSSKKIEISFQSDFTVTRISRPLILKTNLSYDVSYVLVAQLPTKGLEQCTGLMSRPLWEEKIRNGAIVMLIITFVLVLIAVHIDYGNIIYNQSAIYLARDKGTVHPTFNLRNIAMRSTQHNYNETVTTAPVETNHNNRNKLKLSATEKNDAPPAGTLRKRNVIKNSKSDTKSRNTITLADMVSWTFGTKTQKKTTVNTKNDKAVEQNTSNNVNSPLTTGNEVKSIKSKFTEKSLIEKMDGDIKKSQSSRKSKFAEKSQPKLQERTVEEIKQTKDEAQEKDTKKEKYSPKTQTRSSSNTAESYPAATTNVKEHRKSLELVINSINLESSPSDKIAAQQTSQANNTNIRKLGKTPGRERRKQSAQNTSPATSDITSSSSSTSSSCSSNHNAAAGKRYERKPKVKASNSLKFNNPTNSVSTIFPPPSSSSSSSPITNLIKPETSKRMDILTPWDCGSQVSFSDVLQTNQQQQSLMNNSTDLINQTSSLFDLTPSLHSHEAMENSEIAAALTPKRPKNPVTDLGPIGSRKSPSSTPIWEPLNSAITMQLPRPLNITSNTSSSSPTYYPRNSHFFFQDINTMQTQISPTHHAQHQQNLQHHHRTDFEITAQLLELEKAKEELHRQWLLKQQEQQQQQQQHQNYLNSTNALNHNWSNLSSPLWTPILGNGSSAVTTNTASVFGQPQNSTWSLTSGSPGLVRPPPGLEQNYINNNMTPMHNHQTLSNSAGIASSSPGLSSSSSSSFNNTIASSSNGLSQTSLDNDNIPMFNLFGGLSSIWNDNWIQSTTTNQPQQQEKQSAPQNPQ